MNPAMRDDDAMDDSRDSEPPPTPYPQAPAIPSTTLPGSGQSVVPFVGEQVPVEALVDHPPHDPTVDTGAARGTEVGYACVKNMKTGR